MPDMDRLKPNQAHDATREARPKDASTSPLDNDPAQLDRLAQHPDELPLDEKPPGAPGGIAGHASQEEREDPVTLASDDSFPASDPPAH